MLDKEEIEKYEEIIRLLKEIREELKKSNEQDR